MASSDSETSEYSSSAKRRRSEIEDDGEENVVNTSRSKGVVTASLVIRKAHQMVEDCSADNPHIVCWSQDGTRFEVKDREELESRILPMYFNHSAFSSFSKQMNVYGFLKWKTEPIKKTETVADSFMFQHEYFRQGRLDLLKNIKRKPAGSSRNKKAKPSPGEVQSIEQRLQVMEDAQAYLKTTVSRLERVNDETKAAMEMMQKQDRDKENAIQAQEHRIRQLEAKLLSILQHQSGNNSFVSQPSSLPMYNHGSVSNNRGSNNHQLNNQSLSSPVPAPSLSGNRVVSGPVWGNSSSGATLRPHPNKKSLPSFALATTGAARAAPGTAGPTLRPHPNKKNLPQPLGLGSGATQSHGGVSNQNPNGDPLSYAVFRETSGDSLSALLARYDSLGDKTNV